MVQDCFLCSGENNYHSLSGLLYKYCFYFLYPPLLNFAHVLPGDYSCNPHGYAYHSLKTTVLEFESRTLIILFMYLMLTLIFVGHFNVKQIHAFMKCFTKMYNPSIF